MESRWRQAAMKTDRRENTPILFRQIGAMGLSLPLEKTCSKGRLAVPTLRRLRR